MSKVCKVQLKWKDPSHPIPPRWKTQSLKPSWTCCWRRLRPLSRLQWLKHDKHDLLPFTVMDFIIRHGNVYISFAPLGRIRHGPISSKGARHRRKHKIVSFSHVTWEDAIYFLFPILPLHAALCASNLVTCRMTQNFSANSRRLLTSATPPSTEAAGASWGHNLTPWRFEDSNYTVLICTYCTYTLLYSLANSSHERPVLGFLWRLSGLHPWTCRFENRAPGKILARTPTIVYMKLCGGMRVMQWPIQNLAACDDGRPLWAYMTKTLITHKK